MPCWPDFNFTRICLARKAARLVGDHDETRPLQGVDRFFFLHDLFRQNQRVRRFAPQGKLVVDGSTLHQRLVGYVQYGQHSVDTIIQSSVIKYSCA